MKKSQSAWAKSYAETEQRIRQDERSKVFGKMFALNKRIKALLLDILKSTAKQAGRDGDAEVHIAGIGKVYPAPKRKAVTANASQVATVYDALYQLVGKSVTAKALKGSTGLGLKFIGSALRSLVESGLAVEAKRGFFQAKPAETKEDGDEWPPGFN